jgi:hypothetical protein
MESLVLRALVRRKLADGDLPHDALVRVWDGPGHRERCDACDAAISEKQAVMACVSTDASKRDQHFHLECMYIWYLERTPPGRLG